MSSSAVPPPWETMNSATLLVTLSTAAGPEIVALTAPLAAACPTNKALPAAVRLGIATVAPVMFKVTFGAMRVFWKLAGLVYCNDPMVPAKFPSTPSR